MRAPEDLPLVSGLNRGEVRYYTEDPDLGWSVPYSTSELTATVYVYPIPQSGSMDRSAILAREFLETVSEMVQSATSRGFRVTPLHESPGKVDANRLSGSAH